METKKALLFTFTIGAIILGVTLFKKFDFQTFTFEKPALAVVYIIGFIMCISFIIKNAKSKQ
ncbi:MAG TPA: hypothetical protein PKE30_20370 [Niabella sp.]|nr:hypothetical protein [Niabella sp.]